MRKYKKDLCLSERQEIYKLLEAGLGIREIARVIKRNPSTVSRERRRYRSLRCWGRMAWYEQAKLAQDKAKERRAGRRDRKRRLKNERLCGFVYQCLQKGWSPKIIACRVRREFSGETLSHETIYRYIYFVDRELVKYLPRRGRSKRMNRASGKRSRALKVAAEKRNIVERCIEANNRSELGHHESDLIVSGHQAKSCLLVLVDRKARRVLLRKTPNREAETVRQVIFSILNNLPQRRSLTVDNGSEHSALPLLEPVFKEENFQVFFCNPYCAWERGTVENINGLIRRFFPKRTNFDSVTAEQIQYVEDWINNRPMLCLDGLTPNEVFMEEQLKRAA